MLAKEITDRNFKSSISNAAANSPFDDTKILRGQLTQHRNNINTNYSSVESQSRVLMDPEIAVLDIHSKNTDSSNNNNDTPWNDQLEEQFMEFAENCRRDAQNCLLRYRNYKKYDDMLRIGSITIGAFVVITSISSWNSDIRQIINACFGAISSALAGISTITRYARKSEAEKNAYFQLNRLALNINIELNRPVSVRIAPNIYITTLSDQREKILTNTQLDLP